jgi:4'-phosphopantetheinyl transferase
VAKDVVHVWRANLATVADELGNLLCAGERARAARLVSERNRLLWIRSRGVLRALLARYLLLDPRALRFSREQHGKPMLDSTGARPAPAAGPGSERSASADLRFNLSHSGELALYAVSVGRAVGIDVEVARRPIDELAIATRVLGHAQAERLSTLDPAARTREFLRAWVTHEAAVKCHGTGLGRSARSSEDSVWTVDLDVGPGAAAAVSAEQEPCELRLWEWSD